MVNFLEKPSLLSKGVYLQLVVEMKLLDDAIIRSNEAEEVLTYHYKAEGLRNRFIIPWRKVKGKLRRLVMEKQRSYNIQPDCALKDDLCLNCPSCLLFGGTGETSSSKVQYNILSRVLGETFISTSEVEGIQNYTQNAVGEKDLMTGQALMTVLTVPKETLFKGVVTIKDPTKEMASVIIDNIQRLTRIGARSVEVGRVETSIVNYKLSDREDISVYNLLQNQTQQVPQNDVASFIAGLPAVETAYSTLNNQIPELLKDLIGRRSPKKDKKSKTKEGESTAGEE